MKTIVFLITFILFVGAKELPSYITPCNRNSDIPKCIQANLQAARPYITRGIPRLSIPPLDPLKIPEASMAVSNYSFSARNIEFIGADGLEFKELVVDLEKGIFNTRILFPVLNVTGNYTMTGSLAGLVVNGSSFGWGHLRKVQMCVKLKGDEKLIDNKIHLDFKKVGFEYISSEGGNLYFDNLIEGNPEISEQANEILNQPQNYQTFMNVIAPMFDAMFGSIYLEIVRSNFLKFPLEQLFPTK